jgi:hypothetical protein
MPVAGSPCLTNDSPTRMAPVPACTQQKQQKLSLLCKGAHAGLHHHLLFHTTAF